MSHKEFQTLKLKEQHIYHKKLTIEKFSQKGRQATGGPIRHKRIEYGTSPYQSTNMSYLTPPSDLNWRRSSSDSAIHQSLNQQHFMQENMDLLHPHTHLTLNPAMHRNVDTNNQSAKSNPIPIQLSPNSSALDVRSRSASQTNRSPYLR